MGRFDETDVGHSREPPVLCWSLERKDSLAEQRGRKGMPINWDTLRSQREPRTKVFLYFIIPKLGVLFMNITSSPCV